MTRHPVVLDAAVVIALLDADDVHHAAAVEMLVGVVGEPLVMSVVNHAEVLVGAARAGRLETALDAVERLGVDVWDVPATAGAELAHLRAATGAKLPDCAAMLTTRQCSGRLATFDRRLLAAADAVGVATLSA